MSNPNFLTANTQGIELMPGVNDTAIGYDINRVIQALNGTNVLPITTGDLTVSGSLLVSGATNLSGVLNASGDITAPDFIATGGTLAEFGLSNVGNKIALAAGTVGTARLMMGTATGNTWEIDNNNGTLRFFQPGLLYASLTASLFSVTPTVSVHNGINFSQGSTGVVAPAIYTPAGFNDIIIAPATGSWFYVQPGNSATNQVYINNVGDFHLTNPTSKIVPGATSLSLRNNADNADNFILTDAGLATLRNALTIPPSAGATPVASSYGSVPVKLYENSNPSGNPVTFSSIPQGYRHLRVRISAAVAGAGTPEVGVQFNTDTGNNYVSFNTWQNGAGTNQQNLRNGVANIQVGFVNTNTNSNSTAFIQFEVFDYANSSTHKFIRGSWYEVTVYGTANGNQNLGESGGVWKSNSAITAMSFVLSAQTYNNGLITVEGIP